MWTRILVELPLSNSTWMLYVLTVTEPNLDKKKKPLHVCLHPKWNEYEKTKKYFESPVFQNVSLILEAIRYFIYFIA